MHKSDREKIQSCCGYSDIYNNLLDYIAHNFPGYKIGHLKHVDFGDSLTHNDGVHNTIQYIQLNKDDGKTVNVVSDNYQGEWVYSEYSEIFEVEQATMLSGE
jgi:hypothetical protein